MSLPIRPDLGICIARAWRRISGAGAVWTGAERVAIAVETRAAATCTTCERQRGALSPTQVSEAHANATSLPAVAVEAIHRVRSDSGRLTERWYASLLGPSFTDAHYVELVGIVATVMALDTHRVARGEPLDPLPAPRAGDPTQHRPANARRQIAWVPTLSPLDVEPVDPDPYPGKRPEHAVHIHQALSLVPEATAGFFDLDEAMYLPQAAIRDFDSRHRAITSPQIELVAARLSALNGCEY